MYICPYYELMMVSRAPYSITIIVTERHLYLIKDKKIFKAYPVAVGKPTDTIPTTLGMRFGIER